MKKQHTADDVVIERVPKAVAAAALRKDRSLRPGPSVVEIAAEGDLQATLIAQAWKFHEPVTTVSREQHEKMLARNPVTFIG